MQRVNIAIAGRTNAGKSTLMNLLTQQKLSIVHSTPGTTADVKTTVMEIHGFSPVKIFDTAGIDEKGELGSIKKEKSFDAIKRSDIILLVIDDNEQLYFKDGFSSEKEIIKIVERRGKELFIIYNTTRINVKKNSNWTIEINKHINSEEKIFSLKIDLSNKHNYTNLITFLKDNSKLTIKTTTLLPFLEKDSVVFLNIPIDDESPEGRFLKPQMMIEEYLVRKFISTFAYRMDLDKARSNSKEIHDSEKERFLSFIKYLQNQNKLKLLITDSQAMDIISKWTKDIDIQITTFSIVMINYLSRGNLELFVHGIKAFEKLRKGDRIMIAEGCNHDRKAEDIGTKQIPEKIDHLFGKGNIQIDHYFGRVFADEKRLTEYKLIIHCGGCMLDEQHIRSRIDDLIEAGVSFTNYGVLLSYFQGKESLNRVIEPFGIKL